MKNDQPAGQPACGSKLPKTQAAELRPPCAIVKRHTTIAISPASVQKMAKVYFHEEGQHSRRSERRHVNISSTKHTSSQGSHLFPKAEIE